MHATDLGFALDSITCAATLLQVNPVISPRLLACWPRRQSADISIMLQDLATCPIDQKALHSAVTPK